MVDDDMMNAPKVQEIVSTRSISIQGAHELLSMFLDKEREDAVAEGGDKELRIRLDAVCASLVSTSNTDNKTLDKRANKAAKKSAKKERKEKRKREKESSKKSKKSKDS